MNRFVITDPAHCIACHACEVACVMSHNHACLPETAEDFLPRIHVIQNAQTRSALTCRHCDNAPCVEVCPTNALIFKNNSVQTIAGKCIGCKSCMMACPFGAINILTEPRADSSQLPAAYPLKCDLCEGNPDGQACVNACPTQAIRLIDDKFIAATLSQKQKRNLTGQHPSVSTAPILETLAATPRQDPQKKNITVRQTTFSEIYENFTPLQTEEQGTRCATCGEHSFCEWTCPLHNHIPQWIRLAKEGRILEAAELSHQTSSLPEICGRVCPQDRLCEGSCTLKRLELGAVTVGNIERYITDTAFAMGWKPDLSYVKPTGKRVAIIGAGPAGLGCADILTRNGIKADVYDRHPEIGGLLTFGIPAFKLDKAILTHRRHLFTEMGINFHLNTEVGKDIPFERLLESYDAVFIGVGAYQYTHAGLENENAPGVYDALPFLIANTRHIMGLPQLENEPYINMAGKHVVVLGGGDTAMDCVRTSIRQQAAHVTCAYRRDEANMPGSKKEVKNAKEEGVHFQFNVQPLQIVLSEQGAVAGIKMIRTEMGQPDASGRRRPQPVPGSEFILKAQAIIMAFGFSNHPMPWLTQYGVELNKWGGIIAPRGKGQYGQTSNPKIFAGGDVVRGADLVVTAMSDGRKAAQGIITYLGETSQSPAPGNSSKPEVTV